MLTEKIERRTIRGPSPTGARRKSQSDTHIDAAASRGGSGDEEADLLT